MTEVTNASERRCQAQNRRGERCAARVVNAAGYCVAHDPERPADMRELGKRSGEARRRPNPERVPASLRDELRNLDPTVVRAAIEQTLAGGNESARVSAVKLLADVDAFRKDDAVCPRCARFTDAEAKAASAKLDMLLSTQITRVLQGELGGKGDNDNDAPMTRMVRAAVRRGIAGHEQELAVAVEAAVGRVLDQIAGGLVVNNDVDPERAAGILAALEESGLLVRSCRVEELVEERTQQRLAAMKQEHGIPA
jgi:hypothetical protein